MNGYSYESRTIRESAILTNSFTPADIIEQTGSFFLTEKNQLALYVYFTKGSSTSMEVRVRFSPDSITSNRFLKETTKSISGSTTTLTPNDYTMTESGIILINTKAKYIEVSVKCTGSTSGTLCELVAVTGVT